MRGCAYLLLLLLATLSLATEPRVHAPEVVPLPGSVVELRLGMARDQAAKRLAPFNLELAGEERGRAVYETDYEAGELEYTVRATFVADTLVGVAVSTLDSGAVEQWFRNLADLLPPVATFEQTTDGEEMVTERWTVREIVWTTEHPVRVEPGLDMTYWEIRYR